MIIKVKPDKEKVKSMLRLIENREEAITVLDAKKFSTEVAEMYYEVIKELSSALILLDGFRSVGENAHRDLINFLSRYNTISEKDLVFIHDLRIKRNKSFYEGRMIEEDYIENRQKLLKGIIKKLKLLINNELKK